MEALTSWDKKDALDAAASSSPGAQMLPACATSSSFATRWAHASAQRSLTCMDRCGQCHGWACCGTIAMVANLVGR